MLLAEVVLVLALERLTVVRPDAQEAKQAAAAQNEDAGDRAGSRVATGVHDQRNDKAETNHANPEPTSIGALDPTLSHALLGAVASAQERQDHDEKDRQLGKAEDDVEHMQELVDMMSGNQVRHGRNARPTAQRQHDAGASGRKSRGREQDRQSRRRPEGVSLQGGQHNARVDHDAEASNASSTQPHAGKATEEVEHAQEAEDGNLRAPVAKQPEQVAEGGDGQQHGTPFDDGGCGDVRTVEYRRLAELFDEEEQTQNNREQRDEVREHERLHQAGAREHERGQNPGQEEDTAAEATQEQVRGDLETPVTMLVLNLSILFLVLFHIHYRVPPRSGM